MERVSLIIVTKLRKKEINIKKDIMKLSKNIIEKKYKRD